jgi:hypothetical protein
LHYILASEKVEIIQTSKIKEHDQMKQLNTIIPNNSLKYSANISMLSKRTSITKQSDHGIFKIKLFNTERGLF